MFGWSGEMQPHLKVYSWSVATWRYQRTSDNIPRYRFCMFTLWIQYTFIISAHHCVERTMPNRDRWNWNQIVFQIHIFFWIWRSWFVICEAISLLAILLKRHRGYNCKNGKENILPSGQISILRKLGQTEPGNFTKPWCQIQQSLEESTIDCSENRTMD